MLKKIVITVVCLAIAAGLVFWKLYPRIKGAGPGAPAAKTAAPAKDARVSAPKEIPNLGPPGDYQVVGDTLDMEVSEWPGYAPIIIANGGLAPNENSYFYQKHKFKLKIAVSEAESESWQALNSGRLAFNVTTVDVLALYGNQLKAEVPLQLDFSRGGDGLLVTKDIGDINQLKGKVVAVAQFTESEFLMRFLAQEAGLSIKPLRGLSDAVSVDSVNLLYAETAFDAGDLFVESVKNGDGLISGAMTWSPKTVEIPAENPDTIRLLTTNRNLLVVADILLVNAGLARQHPEIVKGLVEGILVGGDMLAKNPDASIAVAAKAFNMAPDELRRSLTEVHISNYPENMAFFANEPGQIGNFSEIYYTAVYAYGKQVIANPIAPQKLFNRKYLEELAQGGLFAAQTVALGPVKASEKTESLEKHPLLTKQIRFAFQPNSTDLDTAATVNAEALQNLCNLLKLSPGSYLMLRGHLDNTRVPEFKQRGEAFYRKQAVRAVEQSKQRAESVKTALLQAMTMDVSRIDTEGRGWDEPLPGAQSDDNRRVEVQVFTLE